MVLCLCRNPNNVVTDIEERDVLRDGSTLEGNGAYDPIANRQNLKRRENLLDIRFMVNSCDRTKHTKHAKHAKHAKYAMARLVVDDNWI